MIFYDQSNYKLRASKKNMQLVIKVDEKNFLQIIFLKILQKNIILYQIVNLDSLETFQKQI